jgi:hypothetical protein
MLLLQARVESLSLLADMSDPTSQLPARLYALGEYPDPSILFLHTPMPSLTSLTLEMPLSEAWLTALASGTVASLAPLVYKLNCLSTLRVCRLVLIMNDAL